MEKQEVAVADRMQKRGRGAQDVLEHLQRGRSRERNRGPSKSAVYRFLYAATYVRGKSEGRGRKLALPQGLLGTANAQRLKLLKSADNDYAVTWEEV